MQRCRAASAMQVLDEFYENLQSVGVSAVTGEGMPQLFEAVEKCRDEYYKFYRPEIERKAKVICVQKPRMLILDCTRLPYMPHHRVQVF